jgi:hypothetical protein
MAALLLQKEDAETAPEINHHKKGCVFMEQTGLEEKPEIMLEMF